MKKILVAVAISMLASTAAFAGITNTKHDLSSGSTTSIKTNGTSQICIFCHTPHNAAVNVPLWNRSNPLASTYKLYTSSASLTSATRASVLDAKSISLLCLSCHDGTLAQLGSRVVEGKASIGTIGEGTTAGDWAANGANLGSDLQNDHPIGFNYNTAATQDTSANLNALTTVNSNIGNGGSAFYGAAKQTMECSSCHLVHNNDNAPFLRKTNAGSQLCLACHNK